MHLSSVFWLDESHLKIVAYVPFYLAFVYESSFSSLAAWCPVPVLAAFQWMPLIPVVSLFLKI